MTSDELEIVQKATNILYREKDRGIYDGHEFDIFIEAVQKADKAIEIAKQRVVDVKK